MSNGLNMAKQKDVFPNSADISEIDSKLMRNRRVLSNSFSFFKSYIITACYHQHADHFPHCWLCQERREGRSHAEAGQRSFPVWIALSNLDVDVLNARKIRRKRRIPKIALLASVTSPFQFRNVPHFSFCEQFSMYEY